MISRSPFFYVGDKYKLMPQLSKLMPDDINTFYDAFVGGGSAYLNIEANRYCVNDIDENVIALHKEFSQFANDFDYIINDLFSIIDDYGLTCSYLGKTVPKELKTQYPKTYFAKYNKDAYARLRDTYNDNPNNIILYILLIYGFNHIIRFNSSGKFNLPVGNVDLNNNVVTALANYLDFANTHSVDFYCQDYKGFISSIDFQDGDFIYLDPPYLITNSEYNKIWSEKEERELYELLDTLDKKGIKFGLSNMLCYKGRDNPILESWSKKYYTIPISSNYISFNDNTIKKESKEVYVTNHKKQ